MNGDWIYYPKFRGNNVVHLLHEPNGRKTPAGWQLTLCGHLVNEKYIEPAGAEAVKCKTCEKRNHDRTP